jgi:hypothetical protein
MIGCPALSARTGPMSRAIGRSDGDVNPANNYSNLQNVNPYTARPRQRPAENYSGYVDPDDDESTIGDGDSGEEGDGGDEDGD